MSDTGKSIKTILDVVEEWKLDSAKDHDAEIRFALFAVRALGRSKTLSYSKTWTYLTNFISG